MAVYRIPIVLEWTGPGSPGVNVWHGRTTTDTGDGAELQGLVDNLHAFYKALNTGSNDTIYAQGTNISLGQVTNVQDQSVASPTFVRMSAEVGQGDLAPVLQVCVSWRTSIAARRARGRTFIGPLNAGAAQGDGAINGSARDRIAAAGAALIGANGGAQGGALGVYGLLTAGTGTTPNAPRVLRDFTGLTIGPEFAVLRSRRD